jgi:hypothetical protein
MAIENVQQLLTEQLGKNFYCVYFPVESVVSAITAASVTNVTALQTTLPAGTTLFLQGITAMTLTSGIAIGYTE